MKLVPASILIIRLNQPFLDWLNQLPDGDGHVYTLEELNRDRTVLLLPDFDFENEAISYIRKRFRDIWAEELEAWCTEVAWWPEIDHLTWSTFQRWITVEFHSMVLNLIEDDENTPPDEENGRAQPSP